MASWHGIEVKRGNIVRPLLFAQKHEIETYAKENNIQWRMDSSNLKEDYTRNLIRQQMIPVLKKSIHLLWKRCFIMLKLYRKPKNYS